MRVLRVISRAHNNVLSQPYLAQFPRRSTRLRYHVQNQRVFDDASSRIKQKPDKDQGEVKNST